MRHPIFDQDTIWQKRNVPDFLVFIKLKVVETGDAALKLQINIIPLYKCTCMYQISFFLIRISHDLTWYKKFISPF